MKSRYFTTVFLLIIIISLVARISKVDYPLSFGFIWGDGTRDYLIANHILKYQEFPSLGPFNLLFESGIYGSPLYFYVLSLILFFSNSILTLSIANILLQLVVIVLIYLISKNLFGQLTAIIASVLFSFNAEVLHHSDFIWQPYLMQPIIYLALYFLVLALIQKADFKLFLSLFLLSLAITLHNSALPWLPFFLFAAVLVLKRDRRTPKYYLGIILTLILSTIIFYLPVALYKFGQSNQINLGKSDILVQSVGQYYSNLLSNGNQFLAAFGYRVQEVPLFILVIMTIWYFFKTQDNVNRKKLTFLILILVLLPIIFASFFNKLRLHYLILSMGPLCIFTGKMISSLSRVSVYKFRTSRHSGKRSRAKSRESASRISLQRWANERDSGVILQCRTPQNDNYEISGVLLSILLFLFFFKVFSSDFNFLKDSKNPFTDYNSIEVITNIIKEQLKFIRKKGDFSDFGFFQVRSFAQSKKVFYYPVLDTILLVPLETKLNQKLTKVSDSSPYNHVQIGGIQYIIIACYQVECLEAFKNQNPQYAILKSIYGSGLVSIYLAKLHIPLSAKIKLCPFPNSSYRNDCR